MALYEQIVQPPAAVYPSRLGDPGEPCPMSRRAALLLAGLLLLALGTRGLMAWRLTVICDDAYYYMSVADALEHGRLRRAFHYLNLNVYPVVLALLNKSGLDWALAAKLWGALVSALVVLPLFGLARRLFDVRVAAAACFLYAVHPDLIETSVEPIREPTFWFLFVVSLYLIWRAVMEARWWQFAAAGVAVALAIHTRCEGWLLMPVAVLWALLRMRESAAGRGRLAAGTLLSLAMTPALLVLVNVTVLHDHHRWEWGRLTHFETFYDWLRSDISEENIHVAAANARHDEDPRPAESRTSASDTPPIAQPSTNGAEPADSEAVAVNTAAPTTAHYGMPASKPADGKAADDVFVVPPEATASPLHDGRLKTLIRQFVRKLEPFNLILMLIGVCWWWRTIILQGDKLVLTLLFASLLLAIWVRLSQIGDMNGRYFFTAYLVAAPTAALGLLFVLNRLGRLGTRLASSGWRRTAPTFALLVLLPAFAVFEVVTARHHDRDAQAALGHWLRDEFGPFESVMVDLGSTRVGYYAQGTMPTIAYFYPTPVYAYEEKLGVPDFVILSKALSPPDYRIVVEHQVGYIGLRRIDESQLPPKAREYVVFVRRQPDGRIAGAAASEGR